MRYVLLLPLFLALYGHAEAHVPMFPEYERVADTTTVEDPTLSQAYYGELTGFPHTFVLHSKTPFELYASIQQPDLGSSERNISGIVVRSIEETGRVEEVARLRSGVANWQAHFEPFGGDTYLEGPEFREMVPAGTYRIEVSTPDNIGKYVLTVGTREDFSGLGYFETVRRIAKVKQFFEKSRLRVVESPFVYVPLGVLLLFGAGVFYLLRRDTHKTHVV